MSTPVLARVRLQSGNFQTVAKVRVHGHNYGTRCKGWGKAEKRQVNNKNGSWTVWGGSGGSTAPMGSLSVQPGGCLAGMKKLGRLRLLLLTHHSGCMSACLSLRLICEILQVRGCILFPSLVLNKGLAHNRCWSCTVLTENSACQRCSASISGLKQNPMSLDFTWSESLLDQNLRDKFWELAVYTRWLVGFYASSSLLLCGCSYGSHHFI